MATTAEIVTAPPPRAADEWAEANRILPPGSPEPGPFRYTRTPYMVPVCRAFASPRYKRVTFVMGTQMGKSATMFNVIGWRLDDDPAPVIYVGPTQSNIDKVVEPKIAEMFRECDSLNRKLKKEKGETSKHRKNVGGVHLRLAWAGSATELASDSAALTLVDEIDRPDDNASGEGSLEEIAEARGDAYADSKTGYTATPTEGRAERYTHPVTGHTHWAVTDPKQLFSPVWRLWQSGTKHEWMVPHLDPACGEYFSPSSELLWWPGKGTDAECTPSHASRHAKLICPHCGAQIDDSERSRMNARGVAVAPGQLAKSHSEGFVSITQGDQVHIVPYWTAVETDDGNDSFSIWVSGLCSFSAKKSFGFLAKKLLEAIKSGDPGKMMAVHNTGFGEVHSAIGDAPAWEEVYELRDTYSAGQVPEGFDQLICTVDVQKDRVYYVVRAWRPGMTSRLVEWGEIWGDTDKPEVWDEVANLLEQEWEGRTLSLMGVDAGYRTDEVLMFVRKHKGRTRALMGFERLSKAFRMARLEVDTKGKTRKHGDKRWDFDAGLAKAWVHSRVRWPKGQDGDWRLPADVSEEYCQHIVAEEYDESTGKWVKVAKRNDYLDCEGMNYMCARMLRIDRKKAPTDKSEPVPDDEKHDLPSDSDDEPKKTRPVKRRSTAAKRRPRQGFVARGRNSR